MSGYHDHQPIQSVAIRPSQAQYIYGDSRLLPKSLERSPAVGDFYGTGIEIWAGFGPVRQLLRPVFSCFHEQKINFKNILDGENIFGIE